MGIAERKVEMLEEVDRCWVVWVDVCAVVQEWYVCQGMRVGK